jgi:hypothetical protein
LQSIPFGFALGRISSRFLDLIDIATYVYCADQAICRGSKKDEDLGANWRRNLYFRIPIRELSFWNSNPVQNQLVDTLSFLSDDEYHFEFRPMPTATKIQEYLQLDGDKESTDIQEVMMFSGGLDSLAGAIQEAVIDRRKIMLVSHRSTDKVTSRFDRLLSGLRHHSKTYPVHIPVRINKQSLLTQESTQRSRSFLYAALGATFAAGLGLNRLRFYENGVVSLNLPLGSQLVGAKATRTTHPRVLHGFSQLFTHIVGCPFLVENPFILKNKTEIVQLITHAGCSDLIPHTVSCASTRKQTLTHPHCGVCSQCIDRRFAILALGQDSFDPKESYQVDLITGERKSPESQMMLALYVETAIKLRNMNAVEFLSKYGEVNRVLQYLTPNSEGAALSIFQLHQRHAQEIEKVLKRAVRENLDFILQRDLPSSCLIRLLIETNSEGIISIPHPSPPGLPSSDPSIGENVFRKWGQVWQIRFRGSELKILLPSKGAAYLHLLLSHPGCSFRASELVRRVAKNPHDYALDLPIDRMTEEARQAIVDQLAELRADREKAKKDNDEASVHLIDLEIEKLTIELQQSTNNKGKSRTLAGNYERSRKAVRNAMKRTIDTIKKYDSPMAQHFSDLSYLKTGRHVIYNPGSDLIWQTES